jgi:putative aldouronate transport system permease protein
MFNPRTGGILLAFKHFRFGTPFAEMEWVGLQWFEMMWRRPDFWNAMRNTFIISFGRLLFEFPMPVILAILMNEIRRKSSKRIFQTVFTFPHFISWIIVISLMRDMFQITGVVNGLIRELGGEPINFMASPSVMGNYLLIFLSNIWKSAGWGAIIYMASISGIDTQLYEASAVDGANRWHNIIHITWPGIKPTVVVLLILQCGNILGIGFEQIFNLRNAVNQGVIEVLDVYIWRMGFGGALNQSFAVAAGLFRSVINFALLLTANRIAKLLGSEGLF